VLVCPGGRGTRNRMKKNWSGKLWRKRRSVSIQNSRQVTGAWDRCLEKGFASFSRVEVQRWCSWVHQQLGLRMWGAFLKDNDLQRFGCSGGSGILHTPGGTPYPGSKRRFVGHWIAGKTPCLPRGGNWSAPDRICPGLGFAGGFCLLLFGRGCFHF